MKNEGIKRNIEIKIRLTEEENEKLESIAKKLQMSKARMIRNIALGEIMELNMLYNIGIIPIVQNVLAYYQKNFAKEDFWEKIKQD